MSKKKLLEEWQDLFSHVIVLLANFGKDENIEKILKDIDIFVKKLIKER